MRMNTAHWARRAAMLAGVGLLAFGTPATAAAKAPTAKATAARLAGKVAKTHSVTALLAVMRALHIGVFSASGKRLVRGAQRSAHDFYLYEPELDAMANALAQHRTWSLDDLAAFFTKAGFVRRGGAPWDAGSIRAQLARIAVSAAKEKPALPGLLLHDLGLSKSQTRLNALQFFLVTADAFAPTIRRKRPAYRAPATGGCGGGPPVPGGWVLGGTGFSNAGEASSGSGALIDAVHGYLIANVGISTELTPLDGTESHYGPAGHEALAGKELEYRVTVRSTLAPSATAIACGWLAHLPLPGAGGVPGVTVQWASGSLGGHGELSPPLPTDAGGTTTLTFKPKDEAFPGFGTEHTDSGDVFAQVSLDRLGPLSPYASFGPALLQAPWKVTYHQPRGFKFATPLDYPTPPRSEGSNSATAVDAHVCGTTPYGVPWSGTRHNLESGPGGPINDYQRAFDDLVLQPNQPEGPGGMLGLYYYEGRPVPGTFDVQLIEAPSPQAQVRVVDDYPFDGGWILRTVTVPLQDDPTCPDTP